MSESLKEAALRYAEMDFAVFPLKPKGKRPATANGFKDATTDIDKINRWWDKCPDYNIGIATGAVSGGLFVIDLDIDEDKGKNGYESLKDWEMEHGALPETSQSITGRGGYHLFYRDSSTVHNRTGIYNGVDIRGDGGYIVAPPSVHPNGRRYEWEQPPDEVEIAQADSRVFEFLCPVPDKWEKEAFELPDQIPEGQRTDNLMRLVCSLQSKGLTDEAIRAAVAAENNLKCNPPLTDQELNREVFPALKRYQKGTAPYQAVYDKGKFRQQKNHSLDMVTLENAEEKEPEWLITNYVPRYQITTIAGDGGAGKTSIWCSIMAAVTTGTRCFMLDGELVPKEFAECEGETVMFFSAEDSFEYVLKRKLRKNGANLKNILTIDIADDRFQDIKFNSPLFERLIDRYRPALVVLDPIQAFLPPDIQMGQRNAMRACLAPLVGYGEKYGTTFLIVVHSNKQSGLWGRKRIADSADIWDISRSVLMAGETNEAGVRYLSHEKSNYGMTGDTVLYSIDNEKIGFVGYTAKKDKDFVTEIDYSSKQKPQRDEAKDFVLEFLKDGEKEVSELDSMAIAMSITKSTLKRAKADLNREKKIKYRTVSLGKGQGTKYYLSLIPCENVD